MVNSIEPECELSIEPVAYLSRAGSDECFLLSKKYLLLGRASDNDSIISEDPTVSRYHALIYLRDGKYFVDDLGSRNGTWINEERVASTGELNPGDVLHLGLTKLVFRLSAIPAFITSKVGKSDMLAGITTMELADGKTVKCKTV